MGAITEALINVLNQMGFTDFLLPFLLFFAIIYATLDKTQIFGKDRRDINALIAFAIAMIAAMTSWVVKAVTGFIPWIAFVMVVVVGILMALALVFGDFESFRNRWNWFGKIAIAVISLVLIAAAIASSPLTASGTGNFKIPLDTEDIAMLIILVMALAFFAVITRKPKTGGS